jgi:hypothetical protein
MSEEKQIDETTSFEVVTSEAVEPEKAKETTGEESATPEQNSKETDKKDDKKPADDDGEDSQPKKGNGRFQKRIDRLTKRAAEAERRAEEAERKLKEGEKGGKAKPETPSEDEPDPSEFDTYDEYLDALSDWNAGDKSKPTKEDNDKGNAVDDDTGKKAEQDDDHEFSEALEDVQDAFSESRSKYSDFDAIVIEQKDLQISREMVIAMAESEDPGEIAYHLGKNKEEAARIAKLSPIAQAREIGKLEAKLAAKPKQPIKKTTEAPDPIDPVKGNDSTKKSMKDMDFKEYERTRNEQEQKGKGFW